MSLIRKFSLLLFFVGSFCSPNIGQHEMMRWSKHANQVEIIRDEYGIPHIYGKTNADAVFGLMYAQCEDDFKRVELNYIEKLGRKSEINGEKDIYNDLYIRLIIDTLDAKKDFRKSPKWLKELMVAFADGINYYLYKHPEVKPALLSKFEPWYPLLWTDGSIGAINTADVDENDLKAFYTGNYIAKNNSEKNPTGSNGFAIAPSKSASGNAMLYINPHVTFYFRPEVHMVSDQGLNTYGAVTWGQFFVYQGFNEKCGWMHTSCNVDVADVYKEKITKKNGKYYFEYDGKSKAFSTKTIDIYFKKDRQLERKSFPAFFNHHGPVMGIRDNQWITVRNYNRALNGLKQCWQRNIANGLVDYKKVMDLRGNISNSTVYADADGHIAYWHGNYIPKRDPKLNWSVPVDGSVSKFEWQGIHPVEETVHMIDPPNGWLQNCNSTPYSMAGKDSPSKSNYPPYMAPDGENFRGINAVRLLSEPGKLNLETMVKAGYDRKLTAFEILIPALLKRFEAYSLRGDNEFIPLEEPIRILKSWDYKVDTASIATTLAIEWAERLQPALRKTYINPGEDDQVTKMKKFADDATADELLKPLAATVTFLFDTYGTWKMPWGRINRFQRLQGEIIQSPDDHLSSIPIPFASSLWGMLPSYNSRRFEGTNNRYGVSGNSFICAVEFGKKIKAISLLAGGESGDPASPHFWDQAMMYAEGRFKEVLFYKEDVEKHVVKRYKPGE
ncbi:MAG: penicillin acylase family protein [Saprospiraceae bacterium]